MDIIKWYFQKDFEQIVTIWRTKYLSFQGWWEGKERVGGIWAEPVTQSTTFRFLYRLKRLNEYAMCTLGRWEGMMRQREEGRVGWTSFTKYKPSDFCTVRMYTLYNLKHQQYEKYFLLPPLPTHLHPLYLFPCVTPIHMYCLYCVLYKSTNFIIGNFLYFYK